MPTSLVYTIDGTSVTHVFLYHRVSNACISEYADVKLHDFVFDVIVMCVYIYICKSVYIYIYMYIHTYTHMYIHICVYIFE